MILPAGARVLVLGAGGFIGLHIGLALRRAGHHVIASARDVTRLQALGFECFCADLARAETHEPEFWQDAMRDCAGVVNAAGLLTGTPEQMRAVHVLAPAAVYAAMPDGARGVLISAIGVEGDTGFAVTKRQGETAAQTSARAIAILRPGLVLGDGSYGGSSLARAMAVLPGLLPVVGSGTERFNPIHADDLSAIVVEALLLPVPDAPVEIGGPETLTQAEFLQSLRRWLGLRAVPVRRLPYGLALWFGRIGDALRLGPVSATAVRQLSLGAEAATEAMRGRFAHRPRGFSAFLFDRPAGTQDLWHARLYLLRPALRLGLALIWLASAALGLLTPLQAMPGAVQGSGLPDLALLAMARLGGLADLAIGLALLRGWRLRLMGWLQLGLVAGYTAGLTLIAPALWLDPLGGILKNLAVMLLIAVHMVLERER
ncbi:MAG: SDR family oxidoreductase [Rhodobacteraceae bacterium]|nr:SDR family oxidoreductase [Paracoccaceae bacterium]